VIKALSERGMLLARGRLKHQYPHSWRSKKPVIFATRRNGSSRWTRQSRTTARRSRAIRCAPARNTRSRSPMGAAVGPEPHQRHGQLEARLGDLAAARLGRADRGVRAREADGSAEILQDEIVNQRIAEAFMEEGADAWYMDGARERFLGSRCGEDWKKVDDICDVWFDSGSTHAFVLEDRQNFPQLGNIVRKVDGGADTVMYLEGSDQHRGWFQSSLLESCGTRGRAPFDVVLTHGFTLDENGRKMSKSVGNTVEPQKVMKDSGADILRLWVCATDYADDQRIGPEILKNTIETYRKLRNSIRWMLGTLAHFKAGDDGRACRHARAGAADAASARRPGAIVRQAYAEFDYKTVVASLSAS
jgi:isoleucyl-tRNA synthetase